MTRRSEQRGITSGQHVSAEQLLFARKLRREMTPVERRLWARLRRCQIGGHRFRRQQILGRFVADFYCASARLAIEIDGDTHDDAARDTARDCAIARLGVRVVRFTNSQVLHEIESVLESILLEIERDEDAPSPGMGRVGEG